LSTSTAERQWVLGYVTSADAWGPWPIGTLSNGDNTGLLAWVDMYCQAHPLDDIAKAAEKLVAALFDQAKASRK
jgi:hypothetical protein